MDCLTSRAPPEESGDTVLMEDVAACKTKSPCAGKGRVGAAVPRARRPSVGQGREWEF